MKTKWSAIACTFALFSFLIPSALAQSADNSGGRQWPAPEEVVQKLDQKLSLSDDQKAKLTPLIAERQEKMKALASESGRRRKKAREMKAIYSESDEKIKAVLNDDQKQKYAEAEQEMR
ncbi:MAG TPA: hypothetical protein VGF06_11585, partial [Terriglobales bacterium]